MEDMDVGFEEFAAAFGDDDGNQTDTAEETADTENTEDTTEETQTEPEGGETAGEDTEEEAEKDGAEGEDGADSGGSEQKFTIKVNKETREVSYEDAPAWIQKGMDYDRVKGQLETSRQSEQALQAELDKQKPFMEFLTMAAEQSNVTVDQMVEQMHVNLLKGQGMTEAEAKATIRATKAERQLKTINDQQAQKQAEKQAEEESSTARAQREVAEFQKQFPGVQLTEELCNELSSDIQAGMSLTSAYLKHENARQAAQIAELQRKQEADAQNKRNQAKSPGSQRDSGGQRKQTEFDEFMSAFK